MMFASTPIAGTVIRIGIDPLAVIVGSGVGDAQVRSMALRDRAQLLRSEFGRSLRPRSVTGAVGGFLCAVEPTTISTAPSASSSPQAVGDARLDPALTQVRLRGNPEQRRALGERRGNRSRAALRPLERDRSVRLFRTGRLARRPRRRSS